MQSKELYKLFKEIRSSSYLNLPVIKSVDSSTARQESEQDWMFFVTGKKDKKFQLHKRTNYKEKGNAEEKAIKNFKVNRKTLDDYLSNENTKNRLAERISQAADFSKGDIDSLITVIGSYIAPLFGYTTGPLVALHETGHAIAADLVFDNIIHHVQVDGFDNFKNFLNEPSLINFGKWLIGWDYKGNGSSGVYNYTSAEGVIELSPLGEKLGLRESLGLIYGGGVIFETILSSLLYLGGLIFSKRKIGRTAKRFAFTWSMGPIGYSSLGIIDPRTETAFAAEAFGMHPALFTALITTPIAVFMGIDYLRGKLNKRKEEQRDYIAYFIDNKKINLDKIFEHFQDYTKNKEINSLERRLASKAEWLFYCERKEQKGTIGKIKEDSKKLLGNYVGFVDFLGKIYEDKIKGQRIKWENWLKTSFQSDYTTFNNELSYFGVPQKKIKGIYNMLHSKYGDFCVDKKKYKVAKEFMKKTGFSENDFPLEKVVSALGNFYEGSSLNLSKIYLPA